MRIAEGGTKTVLTELRSVFHCRIGRLTGHIYMLVRKKVRSAVPDVSRPLLCMECIIYVTEHRMWWRASVTITVLKVFSFLHTDF